MLLRGSKVSFKSAAPCSCRLWLQVLSIGHHHSSVSSDSTCFYETHRSAHNLDRSATLSLARPPRHENTHFTNPTFNPQDLHGAPLPPSTIILPPPQDRGPRRCTPPFSRHPPLRARRSTTSQLNTRAVLTSVTVMLSLSSSRFLVAVSRLASQLDLLDWSSSWASSRGYSHITPAPSQRLTQSTSCAHHALGLKVELAPPRWCAALRFATPLPSPTLQRSPACP